MIPVAHIAGIPVEETIGAFGPAIAAAVGGLGVSLRSRRRRLGAWRRLHGMRDVSDRTDREALR